MAYFLQMDGVDDWLSLPINNTFAKTFILDVEINSLFADGYKSILDARGGGITNSYYNVKEIGGGFAGYKIDGTNASRTVNDTTLPKNKRISIELTGSTTTTTGSIRAFGRGVANEYLSGKIYSIICKNESGAIVAHYDMTTQTVNDQSGNGNHATLTGGTWVDDGVGGNPGTPGTTLFDVKNVMYNATSNLADTRQSLFATDSFNADIRQTMFQVSATHLDTQQAIYSTISTMYDTLQEITDSGIVGATHFDMRFNVFSTDTSGFDTQQRYYSQGGNEYDLKQAIYEASSMVGDVHLVIYANTNTTFATKQTLFAGGTVNFDMAQSMYDPDKSLIGTVFLQGDRKLNVYLVGLDSQDIQLTGKQALNVSLKGLIQ